MDARLAHSLTSRTFATFLARRFAAEKGYRADPVPEAAALAEACDVVLTYRDGMRFRLLCIVDCEAHPDRRFVPSPEALQEIGRACLKYGGKAHGGRVPVLIQVMEVGSAQVSPADQERLAAYRRHSLLSRVLMHAWIISPNQRAVWTNMPFKGWFGERRFIERLMAARRDSGAMG
ncbi:MAG TPA: hypothetical protein VIQ55_06895 [Burkholderiales bacterium]